MSTDQSILQDFSELYTDAYYAWDQFFPEAERDLRFYLGDQWDEQEKRQLFQEGRNAFVFNRVRRNINMITGYQRKHRLSSIVLPVENSDQKTADQLSQLLMHVMNYGDGYRTISDCFGGAIKTGWNLCSVWMDYRDDPINGDIKFGRDPYNGFIVDPYFTKLDWSDCDFLMRRKYLGPDQVASLLPGMEDEIHDIYRAGWARDEKFTWLPYQRQPNGQDLMAYNEFFLQKWRNVPVLVDMETGDFTDFDVPKDRQKLLLSMHENLKIVERPQRYIVRHVIVNDVVMKTDEDPYGLNEYPFVPFTSIWEPESDQWGLKLQSLIRCMRDPQREANRRRSQMIDVLDSQINSGWIANENSVVNPRSLFQTSQGKVIWRREDAPPGAIEKIPPAQIPPSMFQLQELFDKDMTEIAGINDAAFGIADSGNESGVMMMMRQGAAIVNIQDVFDNLRFAQKQLSQKVLKLIQQWTPEKIKRIINEEPTAEFYDREFTKYDVSVQEGMLTETQKQMYFRQLVDLKQLGAPVTGEMLAEAAPIQGKTKYIEQIAQMEQQQAQQAQEQQQIQAKVLQSQGEMSQAKAISDIALSKERYTRAVANMGLEDERAAKAVADRSDAALSRIKAMKELESMDDERIVKYLAIIRSMEDMNRVRENQIKAEDVQISAIGQEIGQPQQQPVVPQGTPEFQQQSTEVLNGAQTGL
ncbi:MAG: hypothetical protein K1000chlam2_00021 [Chlamydiae bacterium]|nr:hypothetical protein [Chlamydiota bacterium]